MPEHIRQEPKVLVSTENLTEQEWLAYRRQGIGGSDVAAILGISPFRTARDLYDDKLNIASAVDDTGNWVALEMGHLLEPLVAQIFAKKTGLEVFQIKKMFQHPQHPFMLADVDYFVRLPNGKIAILEILVPFRMALSDFIVDYRPFTKTKRAASGVRSEHLMQPKVRPLFGGHAGCGLILGSLLSANGRKYLYKKVPAGKTPRPIQRNAIYYRHRLQK